MPSPLGFDGGLTCSIQVKNHQESIAWYRDVLGFELLYVMPEMGWCELRTEVAHVNVGLSEVEQPTPGRGVVLTFGVKDIESARKQLESKKVSFDGPTRVIEGMVKLATFYDPSGNALMFYQDLQKK